MLYLREEKASFKIIQSTFVRWETETLFQSNKSSLILSWINFKHSESISFTLFFLAFSSQNNSIFFCFFFLVLSWFYCITRCPPKMIPVRQIFLCLSIFAWFHHIVKLIFLHQTIKSRFRRLTHGTAL